MLSHRPGMTPSGTAPGTRKCQMKQFRTLDDVDVRSKRVLLRVDLNVPMENGRVSDATRLERVAPGITEISDHGGKGSLLAHFGRPKGRERKSSRGRSHLRMIASARSRRKPWRRCRTATSCASKTPAFIPARKRT